MRIWQFDTKLPSSLAVATKTLGHSGPERPGGLLCFRVGKEPQSARGARLGSAPVSHGGGDSHFFRVYRRGQLLETRFCKDRSCESRGAADPL